MNNAPDTHERTLQDELNEDEAFELLGERLKDDIYIYQILDRAGEE